MKCLLIFYCCCFYQDSLGTQRDDQQNLQQSIEQMFLSVHQKKASLYTLYTISTIWCLHTHICIISVVSNFIDSNKIRHLRQRKLREDKKKLLETINLYNEQVSNEEQIDVAKVESRLAVVGGDSGADLIWPWEMHSSGMGQFFFKVIVSLWSWLNKLMIWRICYSIHTSMPHKRSCSLQC